MARHGRPIYADSQIQAPVSELGEERRETKRNDGDEDRSRIREGRVCRSPPADVRAGVAVAHPSSSGADSAFVNVLTVDAGPVARDEDHDYDDDGDHGSTICIWIGA